MLCGRLSRVLYFVKTEEGMRFVQRGLALASLLVSFLGGTSQAAEDKAVFVTAGTA